MDDIDLRLLAELQEDAAQSNLALAAKVFASPATALRRVRALTEAGVIERTVAVLSPERLGSTVTAIAEITLDVQNAESFAAFARLVAAEPAIQQVWQTAPTVDFTLVLTVRDMAEYQALVQRVFTASNNVRNVRARFATARHKFSTALPLPSPSADPRS
ncbi:MAG: Lrp/AsnC family transcriptional regulator [Burkholderiales bacterium]|nr:Lrp/AsnC family transcriptional regulator [Burkholderiales bacterium]